MVQTINITPLQNQPEFVTRIVAKQHLKIDYDYEDDLIDSIILAAVTAAENYTGRSFFQKTVVLGFDSLPSTVSMIQFPVVDEAFTLQYYNTQSVLTLVDSAKYKYFDALALRPYLNLIDTDLSLELSDRKDAFQVTFTAGMTATSLPKPLYQAILLMIADMYEFRTDRTEIINRASMALMCPYKIWV